MERDSLDSQEREKQYDDVSEENVGLLGTKPNRQKSRFARDVLFMVFLAVAVSSLVLAGIFGLANLPFSHTHAEVSGLKTRCANPSIRREWRTMTDGEQKAYIDAVKCLTKTPSILRNFGSLYDDIPWTHAKQAALNHHSPSFLSWHRYFLHVYETNLRDICGYRGHLAYWDWTLDWKHMSQAPVWDAELGFGGNGDLSEGPVISYGGCVRDGPFAGTTVLYNRTIYEPHCLSRGMLPDYGINGSEWGLGLRPQIIEEALKQETFEDFHAHIEGTPHKEIPEGVRGDFYGFSAPYDPVFAMHHSQLDRLWWMWQQQDPSNRLFEYGGPQGHNSTMQATVSDWLRMHGLAKDVEVRDIMDTEGDMLCYRYS